MVSIIIPIYNEEKTIIECLQSLKMQSFNNFEVIVVDDGSTDKTYQVLSKYQISNIKYQIFKQRHLGTGVARNLGAKKAKGEILVFVDADMTFDKNFIERLIKPIVDKKSKGTFTKEEFVQNWGNIYARCWNYFQGIKDKRRIPVKYPDNSPVFRAILKKEFERIKGFDPIGFTDDWTLSRKLGYQATAVSGAICFHKNPETLKEVYDQAVWIGKNEFISGTYIRRIFNLIRYNHLIQLFKALVLLIKYKELTLLIYSFVYSSGINKGILSTLISKDRNK